MKEKLKDYIEMIFADAPDCLRTRELKEEMYANVCDKYDDLIAEGKSPAAAYNISIASIGDISDLLDSIREEERGYYSHSEEDHDSEDGEATQRFTMAQQAEIDAYRRKKGVLTSISVALYILCWVPLVLITSILELNGMSSEVGGIIGITVMMVMIAVATGLMIYKSYVPRPAFLKGEKFERYNMEEKVRLKKRKNPVLRTISNVLWTLAVIIFLLIGFLGGLWHPGWMVFVITVAIDNVVEAIFEVAGKKYI